MKYSHRMLKNLLRIRIVEQAFLDLFSKGKLNGTVHTCIGQELSAEAFAGSLKKTDFVFSNHRCHGHFISYTKDWKSLILELLGKDKGVCGGIGSSQHLQKFNFFSNGIQGGIVPIAAGYALGNKLKGNDNIGVVYIGDGTLGEGVVYETLNFISKKEIPLIIVCENNFYAQSTPIDYSLSGSIKMRAQSFDIEYRESQTFGSSLEIINEAKDSISWVRKNKKPLFHLVNTYRLKAHSKGDDDRDQDEIESYKKRDFINIFKESDEKYFNEIYSELEKEVWDFVETALSEGEKSIEDFINLKEKKEVINYTPTSIQEERLVSRLNKSFSELIQKENVIFIGEDIVDPYGGAFKVTKGLSTNYPDRVIGTSISESMIVGVSNGLSLNGFKPFAEIMFGDFLGLAFDQLLNHASKIWNMYNKKVHCPVVVRTPMGGGRGYGPTHSQSLEKHFIGMDTFEILSLNRLINTDEFIQYCYDRKDPTLIIENKLEYAKRGRIELPSGYEFVQTNQDLPNYVIKPTLQDSQTTIITYGACLDISLDFLQSALIEFDEIVQILLLTRIDPIDENLLHHVLKNQSKVIFLEEGNRGGTVGDNYISWIAQNLNINEMKVVSSELEIIPSCKTLESQVLVNKKKLIKSL